MLKLGVYKARWKNKTKKHYWTAWVYLQYCPDLPWFRYHRNLPCRPAKTNKQTKKQKQNFKCMVADGLTVVWKHDHTEIFPHRIISYDCLLVSNSERNSVGSAVQSRGQFNKETTSVLYKSDPCFYKFLLKICTRVPTFLHMVFYWIQCLHFLNALHQRFYKTQNKTWICILFVLTANFLKKKWTPSRERACQNCQVSDCRPNTRGMADIWEIRK